MCFFGAERMRDAILQPLKDSALRVLTNARGWKTSRRLVVFESDDWGALRMRDQSALLALRSQGICRDENRYHALDSLENRDDMDKLFDVLQSFRDKQENPPTFTFNTLMGNPDFEAIRASNFEHYVHEDIWDSYQRYRGEDLRDLWAGAIESRLIRPQFHGREHLNVRLWMEDLRSGRESTRKAFDQDYYGLVTETSSQHQRKYLAAYWPESPDHLDEIANIVEEGLDKFENKFGFRSETFVACNYIWPRRLESTTARKGVGLIQSQRGQARPDEHGSTSTFRTYTGMRNDDGQVYSVRNVMFEPYASDSRDWVSSALAEIEGAFNWKKPAIICSHRVNYSSGMSNSHRDRTLSLLNELLEKILWRWPDVEFITSDRLLAEMNG